ncbi:uncharacterized protein DC041_0005333 [Schistosoma bovis]|uniref:Uncharacterized protein n=1 Tax=Schistosoma bovis TaxID=6184 RepID=A0A430QLJ4_SCHBO|nr:uncharacterized protein DC041_0005333 [Schistosoma bovis]CAH8483504.1 unnamed protein product [Schistosoma bovis]
MLLCVIFVLLTYSTFISEAHHTEGGDDEDMDHSKNKEEDKDENENEHEDETEEKNGNDEKTKEKNEEAHENVGEKHKVKEKKKNKDNNKKKSDSEDENVNDENVDSKHGMKAIYKVLKKSFKDGRMKMYKTFDTYLRKDDLDKKMLEVAKILSRRIEKRADYLAQKLKEMLAYETS